MSPMSVDEAAEYLGIPKGTLYMKLSDGSIPATKPGKRYCLYRDELDRWLESSRKNPVPCPMRNSASPCPPPTAASPANVTGKSHGRGQELYQHDPWRPDKGSPDAERYAGKYRRDEHKDRQPDHTRSIAAAHAPCVVDSFWYEGELSCLFADSNVGKSILAVQIADRIARTDNVLYLDFELSEKQFQLRYTDEYGKPYTFPERLYRVSLDCDALLDADFEGTIIGSIEQMAQSRPAAGSSSLTTLLTCAVPWRKAMRAGRLMIQLNNLKKRYGLSILVLAHTPKRSLDCPITSTTLPEASGSTISLTACLSSGKAHWTEDSAM